MVRFPDPITNNEGSNLQRRARQEIDSGLQYACELWHKHLANSSKAPAQMLKITSVLHQFLEGKFLFWLEVLSALGMTRHAVDALDIAARWLEVCQFSVFEKFPLNLQFGSRHHQPLTLSMISSDLSLDSLKSSAYLVHTYTTQPSPYPPRPQLFGSYMSHMLTH